ncbi:hypothetical protein ACOSP7_023664 [Xanthoceras sorbifolium]
MIPHSFTLSESCSNNVSEYTALIMGMELARDIKRRTQLLFCRLPFRWSPVGECPTTAGNLVWAKSLLEEMDLEHREPPLIRTNRDTLQGNIGICRRRGLSTADAVHLSGKGKRDRTSFSRPAWTYGSRGRSSWPLKHYFYDLRSTPTPYQVDASSLDPGEEETQGLVALVKGRMERMTSLPFDGSRRGIHFEGSMQLESCCTSVRN